MQDKFSELKNDTCSAIVKEGISVKTLVTKIIDLPIDFEEYDKIFLKKNSSELRSCSDVPALFVYLRFHWDYLHPDLYGHLIDEFDLHSLIPKLQAYRKDLDDFLDKTLLEDFCQIQPLRKRHITGCNVPEKFVQYVSGHCWDHPVFLRAVEKFRLDFADYFSLNKCAAVVVDILNGSVILAMWVPKSIESKIKSVDSNFLSKHNIVYMELQYNIIYMKVSMIILKNH